MNAAIIQQAQPDTLTLNKGLIVCFFGFMLYPLSQKTKVGICNPRKGEKSPLPLVVFFRPVISNTGLIRVKFIMVDCLRETLKSFARSFAGIANLIQSTAFVLQSNGGGYSLLTKDTATMNTSKNLTPRAKATPDDDGIIRVTDSNLRPPKGYFQLCIYCRFDQFSVAFNYCPKCGCSALSHGVYVAKNGGVA